MKVFYFIHLDFFTPSIKIYKIKGKNEDEADEKYMDSYSNNDSFYMLLTSEQFRKNKKNLIKIIDYDRR